MAYMLATVGRSGTGKSTALFPNPTLKIIGLNPDETIIINPAGKDLPFKGSRRVYPPGESINDSKDIRTNNPKKIARIIRSIDENSGGKFSHIKNIVVDDAQYLQMFTFMDKIEDKGYDKFNETGNAAYLPLKAAADCGRPDLTIIFNYHSENDNGDVKIKTAGKVVDAYLTIEGMFTIVLFTKVVHDSTDKTNKYYFVTQSDGYTTAKSPIDMFPDLLIPNDMGYVLKKVKEYYE
jgi:hypothetical protein